MKSSLFALLFSIHAFGLEEADQAMLLQTKHAVERRIEQHAGLNQTGITLPVNLGDAELVGKNHNKVRNIDRCEAELLPCPMILCSSPDFRGPPIPPLCVDGPWQVWVVNNKLCTGFCQDCVCPPPPEPPIIQPPQPLFGRPFSTETGHLVSATDWQPNGTSDWVPKNWNHTILTLPEGVARFGEQYWRTAGEHEHASIASFARASLDLMRYGAPPELLRDTHIAAMEEVKHAEISFGLASSFKGTGDSLVVNAFPLKNAELSASLDDFASKLLLEGCIGETSAVARMSYAIAHIDPLSPAAHHLVTLRDEEAGHAALAWKSLAWAVSQGAKLPPLPETKPSPNQQPSHDEAEALVWTGAVPRVLGDQIDQSVLLATVIPWVSALNQGRTDFSAVSAALLPGAIADAVTKGSSGVQNRIQEVSI